jgi:hypothetical protein
MFYALRESIPKIPTFIDASLQSSNLLPLINELSLRQFLGKFVDISDIYYYKGIA